MIVHESVWPACGFSVRAYDTALRGLVQLPDPLREYNRLPIDSSIVRSPANTEALRTFPIPNYPDIVRRLTSSLGWDISGARMFSCEVVYPVYGSLVVLARE